MRRALRPFVLALILLATSCGSGSDAASTTSSTAPAEVTTEEATTTTTEATTTTVAETTTTTVAVADRAEMSSAISAALASNRSMVSLGLNTDCAAEAIVDEVGLESLAEAGLREPADAAAFLAEDADPPLEVQGAMFGALNTCADQKTLAQSLQSEISGDLPISIESAECITKELFTGETMTDFMSFIVDDSEFEDMPVEQQAVVVNLILDCLSEEDLTALFAEGIGGDSFTSEQQECMGGGLARMDSLPELITSSISGSDLDFEDLPAETTDQIFGVIFDCISFGEIMAESFAGSGIVMGQAEIDCVDAALEEAGFQVLLDEDGDAVTELLFSCVDFG